MNVLPPASNELASKGMLFSDCTIQFFKDIGNQNKKEDRLQGEGD
jgi:hypothetical protein